MYYRDRFVTISHTTEEKTVFKAVLRDMTPEEQWQINDDIRQLKDDIMSLKHLLDSLVDDCFEHDMVLGFSVRGLDDK